METKIPIYQIDVFTWLSTFNNLQFVLTQNQSAHKVLFLFIAFHTTTVKCDREFLQLQVIEKIQIQFTSKSLDLIDCERFNYTWLICEYLNNLFFLYPGKREIFFSIQFYGNNFYYFFFSKIVKVLGFRYKCKVSRYLNVW